jgi:hypothetical protein
MTINYVNSMYKSGSMIRMASLRLEDLSKQGMAPHEAWNMNSVELVRASKAYLDSFVAVNFMKSVEKLDVKPALRAVLHKLCLLHALHRIVFSAEEFLQVCLLFFHSDHLQRFVTLFAEWSCEH